VSIVCASLTGSVCIAPNIADSVMRKRFTHIYPLSKLAYAFFGPYSHRNPGFSSLLHHPMPNAPHETYTGRRYRFDMRIGMFFAVGRATRIWLENLCDKIFMACVSSAQGGIKVLEGYTGGVDTYGVCGFSNPQDQTVCELLRSDLSFSSAPNHSRL
jgi:hypothetical protein